MRRLKKSEDPKELNSNGLDLEKNFNFDMSEEDREGDEMSGDEHSSGLQGEEPEIEYLPEEITGIPGQAIEDETPSDQIAPNEIEKRRAS